MDFIPEKVNPVINDTILDTAGKEMVSSTHLRGIFAAQEACHLVSKGLAVAILANLSTYPRTTASRYAAISSEFD